MEEWNSTYPGLNQEKPVARPAAWPNESEQIRTILWQQSMTELVYEATKVLIEIRDILREEQVTVGEMTKDVFAYREGPEGYEGKHRKGSDGQREDKTGQA